MLVSRKHLKAFLKVFQYEIRYDGQNSNNQKQTNLLFQFVSNKRATNKRVKMSFHFPQNTRQESQANIRDSAKRYLDGKGNGLLEA